MSFERAFWSSVPRKYFHSLGTTRVSSSYLLESEFSIENRGLMSSYFADSIREYRNAYLIDRARFPYYIEYIVSFIVFLTFYIHLSVPFFSY